LAERFKQQQEKIQTTDLFQGILVGDTQHLAGSGGYPGIASIDEETLRFTYQEPSYTDQLTSYQFAYFQTGLLTPFCES
ncbi:hypothetical protein EBS02_06300, partial [bacterium]|nr:hypothetical protein [bacterium]